jgi:hypothetical protein
MDDDDSFALKSSPMKRFVVTCEVTSSEKSLKMSKNNLFHVRVYVEIMMYKCEVRPSLRSLTASIIKYES